MCGDVFSSLLIPQGNQTNPKINGKIPYQIQTAGCSNNRGVLDWLKKTYFTNDHKFKTWKTTGRQIMKSPQNL